MTLHEYRLRLKANQLKQLDKKLEMAHQALMHRKAKETTGKGKNAKYVHCNPKEMVDFDKLESEILKRTSEEEIKTYDRLAKIAMNLKKYEKERRDSIE